MTRNALHGAPTHIVHRLSGAIQRQRRLLVAAAVALGAMAATPAAHAGTFGSETIAAPTFTDPTLGISKNATGALSKTSDTALADIPGLAISLTNGASYRCQGHLYVSASGASGGIKVATATSDTLTASSFRSTALAYDGTTIANNGSGGTFTGNMLAYTGVVTDVFFDFTIAASAAGTLVIQAAQNVSNATTLSIAGAGTSMTCTKSG